MTNTIEIENLNISDLDIPTDETLQEVATACENIATSSESIATSCDNVATSCNNLAKDTTLQSTNTALGSLAADTTLQATNTALGGLNTSLGGIIKDTTLQATNTALASLMADTTGQSIASAISGLGATLGSDKANIDGSNIANPSAFRTNIGLNIHTETFTGTTNNQGLLTTNIPWTGQILTAYATVVSTSVRVFAIGYRPSGGGYIVSKLMSDNGGAVSESQVTLTITLIG